MSEYKTVFLDLDDTVWDFTTNSKISLEEIYRCYSLDRFYPTFDLYYKTYSEKNTELWNLYHHGRMTKEILVTERFRYPLQLVGVDDTELAKRLDKDYLSVLSRLPNLVMGARELLDYLVSKYTLGIISNGFNETQYRKIDASGIGHYFSEIVLSDEIGINKPHPDIFKEALHRMSIEAADAIMIGDNYDADIRGAMHCGIDQIYFNPLSKPIEEEKPTYEVTSLLEVMKIL